MTTQQITIRIPEERVARADAEVQAGHYRSRAAYIDRLIERDERRAHDLADLQKIIAAGPDPELDSIAAYRATHPIDMSDLD